MTVEIIKPDSPPGIHQVAQQVAESQEVQPYAVPYTQPYPLLSGLGVTGSGGTNGGSSGTGLDVSAGKSEQNPAPYDLEWTAGDSVDFEFFFDNVCWTPVDPSPVALPWEQYFWNSQVRFSAPQYYGYWWPPIRPYGTLLFCFNVVATWFEDYATLGPGTLLELKGGTGWPGVFKWDLQSTHYPNPADTSVWSTRTWMGGKATVNPQTTVLGTAYYGDWGYWAPQHGFAGYPQVNP